MKKCSVKIVYKSGKEQIVHCENTQQARQVININNSIGIKAEIIK